MSKDDYKKFQDNQQAPQEPATPTAADEIGVSKDPS